MIRKVCRSSAVCFTVSVFSPFVFPDCPPNPGHDDRTDYIETDEYSLSIESASGAKGDVVAVTVAVESRMVIPSRWAGLTLAICHDSTVAELVGAPVFTEEVQSMSPPWGPVSWSASKGLLAGTSFSPNAYNTRFPSEVPYSFMTVYYRLIGDPGDVGTLTFCDGVLDIWPGSCLLNRLSYHTEEPYFYAFLTRRKFNGALTVLEGPATHPDRPPEPPEAIVYAEQPTPEQTNFRVRVTDAVGWPGARDVGLDVYAAADVEYTGIELPLDFDERYLRLARVENRLKPLASVINNDNRNEGAGIDEGYAVLFSGLGFNNRRIAPAGEEIHVATLYFEVLESASAIGFTTVTVETVGDRAPVNYPPWIGVRHKSGLTPDAAVVRSEVGPISIIDGLLGIGSGATPFVRGDADGDATVDLSDAQLTLNHLFLGGDAPSCLDAADSNDDGILNIADPIRTLQFLFLGGAQLPPPGSVPGVDPTPDDELDCRYPAA